MDHASISRQQLENACRVLRKPRKSASMRSFSAACALPLPAVRSIVQTIQNQPFVASIRSEKGTWLSYSFTNYAPGLVCMSFCSVICEGRIAEGSESPAAPMFSAETRDQLKTQYQQLAREKEWVYLDVTHDHMAHLLDALEHCFKE